MSSPQVSPDGGSDAVEEAVVDMKLEVIAIPVSDVDRALSFLGGDRP